MNETLNRKFWREVLREYKLHSSDYICIASPVFSLAWKDYETRLEIVRLFRQFLKSKGIECNWHDAVTVDSHNDALVCDFTLNKILNSGVFSAELKGGKMEKFIRLKFLRWMSK